MEAYDERENDRRASRQHHGAVRDGLGVKLPYKEMLLPMAVKA